tara:strand:- start:233 stop:421 length:189 start_codon:yes stop_codon:yes gene_type:complete
LILKKHLINKNMAKEPTTKTKIVKFIDAISDKNYAAANKYLQSAVNDKLESRIKQAAEKPLF